MRARAGDELGAVAGAKGCGFEYAHAALGSKVVKQTVNVYDLSPDELGTFDVVVCGSLLLHLRDPVLALEAIRAVCAGSFLSVEAISLPLTALFRRRPVAELCDDDNRCQWWTVNAAGHRRLVEAAGFEVVRTVKPFAEPFGPRHPARLHRPRGLGALAGAALNRVLLDGQGVPHGALLARPREL
jgi:tRNA (mo5U34)-methyltransferase